MVEDKKQYIVEYSVLADISQASASLMALTSMMQTFNSSYGAGIRQTSVAADRILKSAKTIGQNLGKQIDMSKPIAQMQAFQGALLNTFTNAHRAINGMFAGDMNTMSKAIAGLQNHGFKSEKAIGRMTGQLKSARSEAAALAKTMQNSQQTMNNYSSLYKRFANGIVGKGDNAKLSKSVLNTFNEDERKLIGRLTNDKNWMTSSGQRLNTGVATFKGNLDKAIHTYGESKKAYEEFIRGGSAAVAKSEGAVATAPVMMSAKEMQDKVKATRNMVRSMNKLISENKGKPKKISYTAVLNTEDALAKLTALEAKFRELQNLANISVRVKGGTAAKTFKDQITGINQSVTDLKNTLNSVVSGAAVKKGVGKKNAIPAKIKFDKEAIRKQVASISGAQIPVTIKPVFGTDKQKESMINKIKKGIPPVSLKLNTANATASLNRFIKAIDKVRNQTINLNAVATASYTTPKQPGAKATGGTTTQPKSTATGTTTTQGTAGRRPPQSTRTTAPRRGYSTYPLVGNTSFGVQTPAFVSMAKGMVGMMGIGAAFGLIGDAMSQAVEYQNTMMSVKAILESNKRYTGYTPENFRAMEKNIRNVGMQTKFTAPEVAGAARFMAMAGLSVDQINNSIRPIADVALIGDNDLETTADKITNIQTAFKLGKDPRSMRKLADNLTTTFTRFNTDMMMTAEAMQYAAPVASAAGLGIEDTLAMIGVMGNAGIQSSMAGTTLRMAMQNIIKPNKNQRKLWDKLGISRHNADGSPRNIVDVLTELRSKASDAQLMEIVSNLFRTTSMAGTVQIIRNLDLLKSAREDMILGRDMGLSSKLSGEKQNTIKGLWAQVTSAFTEDNVLMFEKFQGKLKEMLIDIRDYLKSPEAIQNLEHIMELIKTMGSAFGAVARIWMNLYNTFPGAVKAMMVMQFALSQIGLLLNPIVGMFRVLRNMGLATGFIGAAGATGVAGAVGAAGNMMKAGAIPIANAYAGRIAGTVALGSAVSSGLAVNGPMMMKAAGNSMAFQNAVMGGLALSTPMIQKQSLMSRIGASSFGRSFTAARTAGALSLSGVASAGLSGLGTLIGSMLSPIGLTLAGIAASVYLIAKYKKEEREYYVNYKAKSQDNSKFLENARKISSGGVSEEAMRLGLSTGSIANLGNILAKDEPVVAGTWKSNPQFRHTKGFSHIFSDDVAKHRRTAAEYINDMYEQFVKPTTGMSKTDFISRITDGQSFDETNVDEYESTVVNAAARFALPGALKIMSANSIFYKKGENKILGMFEKAAKITDKEKRRDAFSDAYINANKYLQSILPTGSETQISQIGDMNRIGSMKASELAGTYEYKMGLYENLNQLIKDKDNAQMAPYIGLMELDDLTADQFNRRIEILAGITKMAQISLPDVNGAMQDIQIRFENGLVSYNNFIAILEAYNIKVGQNMQTYLNMVSGMFDTMLQNPMYAGYISEADRGAFMVAKQGMYKGKTLNADEYKGLETLARGYAAANGIDFNWWNQRNENGSRRWMNSSDIEKIYNWRYGNGGKQTTPGMNVTDTTTTTGGAGGKGGATSTTYTPDQSGYANHYQRSAARPTQINFNIQNLVNIDKTEFKSVEEQEILSKLEFVVSQASTQLAATAAAQLSALGSTGGDTQDVG